MSGFSRGDRAHRKPGKKTKTKMTSGALHGGVRRKTPENEQQGLPCVFFSGYSSLPRLNLPWFRLAFKSTKSRWRDRSSTKNAAAPRGFHSPQYLVLTEHCLRASFSRGLRRGVRIEGARSISASREMRSFRKIGVVILGRGRHGLACKRRGLRGAE